MKICEYLLLLIDEEKTQNYCMSFFEGEDGGNHAEVPGYIGETLFLASEGGERYYGAGDCY